MNFIRFPVGATNIFPAANAKNGSQLLTEWNLRSRESVATDPSVEYMIGPSYAHSMRDFEVSILTDETGQYVNSYTLCISKGRGVINGHFVECLTDMTIDLVEANATLATDYLETLKGKLAVGIRAFYATEETISGSLLVENDEGMYIGIQLVVLPEESMILPTDSPEDPDKVNCHLKLATFFFQNNNIQSLKNLKTKLGFLDSTRITDVDNIGGDIYVRKKGLNSKKLYSFAGKGTDPLTGKDTWEDVTDSTMIWDASPIRTLNKPTYSQSQFVASMNSVYLCAVHKQVEGMTDDEGNPEYYEPRLIEMPVADYSSDSPGIVNNAYTKQIKDLAGKVREFQTTLTGKQIAYIEKRDEDTEFPTINKAWANGDYLLVGTDETLNSAVDSVKAPSTMYVVIPGIIETILFKEVVEESDEVPDDLVGVELGLITWNAADGQAEPGTDKPEDYPTFWDPEQDEIRGTPGDDYFRLKFIYTDDEGVKHFKNYYYVVDTAGKRTYSDAILLTGEIPLAQTNVIGGFLNVDTSVLDYGYVYRDDAGRLRLLDYNLLRSGVLAYQLGQDITLPSGVTAEETQSYLTEYVNQRVAFPNAEQAESESPNCIHIYISLYEEEEPTQILICDIDSRFNTSVCLHILGEATSSTVINIYDCEKIKIDNSIEGTPVINVYRCGLYYDPYVFNYIRSCEREVNSDTTFTGMEDITVWYERFDSTDPNLVVDHMTVRELDNPVVPQEIDFWNQEGSAVNDNHYLAALNSITFAGNGDIIGCGLLVANDSTDNIEPGEKIIVGDFELPQGSGLSYPKACLTRQLKVTGTFTSAYLSLDDWYVTDTSFSAITATYDQYDQTKTVKGNIAYHSKTTVLPNVLSELTIPAWDTDAYHLFFGGVIS